MNNELNYTGINESFFVDTMENDDLGYSYKTNLCNIEVNKLLSNEDIKEIFKENKITVKNISKHCKKKIEETLFSKMMVSFLINSIFNRKKFTDEEESFYVENIIKSNIANSLGFKNDIVRNDVVLNVTPILLLSDSNKCEIYGRFNCSYNLDIDVEILSFNFKIDLEITNLSKFYKAMKQ